LQNCGWCAGLPEPLPAACWPCACVALTASSYSGDALSAAQHIDLSDSTAKSGCELQHLRHLGSGLLSLDVRKIGQACLKRRTTFASASTLRRRACRRASRQLFLSGVLSVNHCAEQTEETTLHLSIQRQQPEGKCTTLPWC